MLPALGAGDSSSNLGSPIMIPDELLFTIDYKGKKKGIRFDLKDKSKEELAYALARVIEEIGDLAYNFSDLKLKYKKFESLEDAIKKAREMKKENLKELSNLVESAAIYYYLKDSKHLPTPKMFKKIKEEEEVFRSSSSSGSVKKDCRI